uniref:Uncharacterized protein n=1 Tax=Cucumis melo TaxID=3656 RepID=A0A9I9D9Q4_CUCME
MACLEGKADVAARLMEVISSGKGGSLRRMSLERMADEEATEVGSVVDETAVDEKDAATCVGLSSRAQLD